MQRKKIIIPVCCITNMSLEKIPLQPDPKNPGHWTHEGIALTKIEEASALKINEMIDAINSQN